MVSSSLGERLCSDRGTYTLREHLPPNPPLWFLLVVHWSSFVHQRYMIVSPTAAPHLLMTLERLPLSCTAAVHWALFLPASVRAASLRFCSVSFPSLPLPSLTPVTHLHRGSHHRGGLRIVSISRDFPSPLLHFSYSLVCGAFYGLFLLWWLLLFTATMVAYCLFVCLFVCFAF